MFTISKKSINLNTPESFFQSILNKAKKKIDKTKYPDSVFYFIGDTCYFEQDETRQVFYIDDNHICEVLEKTFKYEPEDTRKLIQTLIESHFNICDITVLKRHGRGYHESVEKHFKDSLLINRITNTITTYFNNTNIGRKYAILKTRKEIRSRLKSHPLYSESLFKEIYKILTSYPENSDIRVHGRLIIQKEYVAELKIFKAVYLYGILDPDKAKQMVWDELKNVFSLEEFEKWYENKWWLKDEHGIGCISTKD